MGSPRRGRRLPPSSEVMTREQVYGRRAVREVLRGPRAVLELWVTERALRAEEWLRDTGRLRVQVKRERALNAVAGTPDHQGVLAFCEPYRYADAYELATEQSPLLRSEEHTSELQSRQYLVCRLLLE